MSELSALYQQDTVEVYAASVREDILRLFDRPYARVLDVGCNTGMTGAMLKKKGLAEHVTGIELLEAPAQQAARRIDRVLHMPAETGLDVIANEQFDCILALDVLEHLLNPWEVTSRLASLLAPGGVLITSIPNIRYWRVLKDLVFAGEWRYAESGILDRTHLRFFTGGSIVEMLESSGMTVEVHLSSPEAGKSYWLSRLSFHRLDGFFIHQYLTRCRRGPGLPLK